MNINFEKTDIKDALICKPAVFKDLRGFFFESYKKDIFVKAGIKDDFIQDNCSLSKRNVLRGLHFQIPPFAQAKLIRCLSGEIFDVAVDLRPGSPSFRKWYGCILSQENHFSFYIPAGCAHGFLTISEQSVVNYKISANYSPTNELGIIWNDATININWPLDGSKPILSEKDEKMPDWIELIKAHPKMPDCFR